MASRFLPIVLALSLLIPAALSEQRLSEERQCRFQRLSAAQPNRRIQSEGGSTEIWDERQDQFQCVGVAALRNILKPNALSLPNYQSPPRLIYVERGQALMGVAFPGCAETFHDLEAAKSGQEEQWQGFRDLHQKVHRIRQGDLIAIPAGSVHFCYNDGSEELVTVSVNDLNHQSNQLDDKFRAFYLAGGVPSSSKEEQRTFQNIFWQFDTELLAEAFNVPPELVKRIQAKEQEEHGLSVIAREPMRFITPDEEQMPKGSQRRSSEPINGLEESFCSMDIRATLDNRREAAISSRQAGKLNVVDRHKLGILQYIDLSAEKGNLFPNAMLSPDWAMLGHSIIYVTQGDAQIQVVDNRGQTQMNDRVKQGDIFVVPQFYASTARAGNAGFEWVSFKTTGWPMRNSLVGYTSAIRAMPLEVLTNAYRMSSKEAQELKRNRGQQSYLLSPRWQKQQP